MLDPKIRSDFPILKTKVNGKPLVYFDNAATSQKPQVVIDKLVEYYSKTNANIHRGIHSLSEKATREYELSKEIVRKFINAKDIGEIIYTRNTTESINLVAYSWALNSLKQGDNIILSEMEHHSNIVQWQLVANKIGATIHYIPVKDDYTLDLDKYKELLQLKPKLVSLVHASNVLGTVNPIKQISALAHDNGALVLVDGAQSATHMPLDMQDLGCDFFAFSSHKMCGPTGIGVLYAKRELLEKMPPFLAGGDMIHTVTFKNSTWNELPWKFEAGTPSIADGIAFGEAVKYLQKIGMSEIQKHIREITSYALSKLKKTNDITIFGQDDSVKERDGALAFTMKSIHPHDIAEILNGEGIAIRSGNHCAQPLHTKFGLQASARASFYLYNTKAEVDKFIEALDKVRAVFK